MPYISGDVQRCPSMMRRQTRDYGTTIASPLVYNTSNDYRGGGLGDLIESALAKLGITTGRWIAWKASHGWPPTCNCEARKEWLNKFGEEFGRPARIAVRLAMRLWRRGATVEPKADAPSRD